jgi:hypothetical protein
MRFFLFISFILISANAFGQNIEAEKARIDVEVQRIDQPGKLATKNFTIQALKKVLHYIRYEYVVDKNNYLKISRQFSYKNDSIQQVFYLQNDRLIFAKETIVSYFTDKDRRDTVLWAGVFYFSRGKLIDHTTHGHGKSELDMWNPRQEMEIALKESKRDIARQDAVSIKNK